MKPSPAHAWSNVKYPQPVLVPHENLAVAMAHGVYLMNGRPQAVMVHVNVGTGNTINNVTNLSRDRAPVILAAGRTPFTEKGTFGSRTKARPTSGVGNVRSGQHAARTGEVGLRTEKVPEQVADVTARAYEMSTTAATRPGLSRAAARADLGACFRRQKATAPRQLPAPAYPDPRAIDALAEMIAKSQSPLIVTSSEGDPRAAAAALAKLADRYGLPVVAHNARGDATDQSPDAGRFRFLPAGGRSRLSSSVRNATFPGIRISDKLKDGLKVAHIGEDPVYQRYPVRSFQSDLSISVRSAIVFEALDKALEKPFPPSMTAGIDARRKKRPNASRHGRIASPRKTRGAPDKITPQHLSHCIG